MDTKKTIDSFSLSEREKINDMATDGLNEFENTLSIDKIESGPEISAILDEEDSLLILPHVLSLDTKRVRVAKTTEGNYLVQKKSSIDEYKRMKALTDYLRLSPVRLKTRELIVRTVPLKFWDQENALLFTSFCGGLNGEEMLRYYLDEEREGRVRLFKDFLESMRIAGVMWGDCAPRNTIIDSNSGSFWLVDFDRDIYLNEGGFKREDFSDYLRQYAWEEFSCFLFADERDHFFENLIDAGYNNRDDFPVEKIKSQRRKHLLRLLFGDRDYYSVSEMEKIEQMMIEAATAVRIAGKPFFPMDIIDRVASEVGPLKCAELVSELTNKEEKQKISFLLSLEK